MSSPGAFATVQAMPATSDEPRTRGHKKKERTRRQLLDAAIDVSTFSDPEELAKFIEQFTAIWDATNSVADPAIQLFNQGPAYGVSTNMLLTIQSLK